MAKYFYHFYKYGGEVKLSLIKCPECGKNISDKSKQCIHCGFPLDELKIQKYIFINGIKCDASNLYDIINLYKNDNEKNGIYKKIYDQIETYDLSPEDICKLSNQIFKTKTIPKEYNGQTQEEYLKQKNTIHCPKCGSTVISTGQKGYSLLSGFLGSNKTVNRCAICGHRWDPKK